MTTAAQTYLLAICDAHRLQRAIGAAILKGDAQPGEVRALIRRQADAWGRALAQRGEIGEPAIADRDWRGWKWTPATETEQLALFEEASG